MERLVGSCLLQIDLPPTVGNVFSFKGSLNQAVFRSLFGRNTMNNEKWNPMLIGQANNFLSIGLPTKRRIKDNAAATADLFSRFLRHLSVGFLCHPRIVNPRIRRDVLPTLFFCDGFAHYVR